MAPISKHYQLSIKLLEDLHSGTGTGSVTVDAVQARNSQGIPVIDRHHFRGVMKDNGKRLCELGVISKDVIHELFGKAGGKQRKLDCSSLTAETKDCLIEWDATARQVNSRCPEENSLRRIEYIRAGIDLTGSVTLNQVSTEAETAFKAILKFTTRLGSERTRGSGQLTIAYKEKPLRHKNIDNTQGNTLKICLCNTEPLCIPKSGYAGNIIRSESHISGRTLFAALCAIAHQTGGDNALQALYQAELRIGNAYPLPAGYESKALDKITSLPMPNQIHAIKQAKNNDENKALSPWPHWAISQNDAENAPELDDIKDINLFEQEPENGLKTERPKGEIYLVEDENNVWRRYTQPMSIRMRNQRGDPCDKTLKRKDLELFSEQRIPENMHFISEIYCEDAGLLNTISQYLEQTLYIGRGKAPLETRQKTSSSENRHQKDSNNTFTITATSDWIIRGDNLGYLTQLNKETLGDLLGITITKLKAYQETEQQGSFNYVSGLPTRPFEVIRRGSSFEIKTDKAITDDDISHFPQTLGERSREGYGQYKINLPVKLKEKAKQLEEQYQQKIAAQEKAKQAELDKKKEELRSVINQLLQNSNGKLPNDRQWKELIDKFKTLPSHCDNQLKIAQFAGTLLGKPCYQGIGKNNLARILYEVSNESGNINLDTLILFLELLKEETQS